MTLADRTTLVQDMNPYTHLVAQFTPTQTEYEHDADRWHRHHIAVLAVFDHDWEQHLLVQQCSSGPAARLLGMDGWEYALYYCGAGEPILIHTFFDATSKPWVEAARMVECWYASGHYEGLSNSVESDSFG